MSFMEPEIFEDSYYEVETNQGIEIVPCSVVAFYGDIPKELLRDYVEGEITDLEQLEQPRHGWICRLSAPGYTDCTAWAACPTEQECKDYLIDTYGEG